MMRGCRKSVRAGQVSRKANLLGSCGNPYLPGNGFGTEGHEQRESLRVRDA